MEPDSAKQKERDPTTGNPKHVDSYAIQLFGFVLNLLTCSINLITDLTAVSNAVTAMITVSMIFVLLIEYPSFLNMIS